MSLYSQTVKKIAQDFLSRARYRITIQQNTPSADNYGGETQSWSTLSTKWASVEPLSGREVFEHQRLESHVTHKFTIRYDSALNDTTAVAKHRISFDGRTFNISYIRDVDQLHEFMEIFAVEGAGN